MCIYTCVHTCVHRSKSRLGLNPCTYIYTYIGLRGVRVKVDPPRVNP